MMLSSTRTFQVWAYSVSMARLLLRSTKAEGAHTRIDVLFQNVKWLNLSTDLDGLSIRELPGEERSRALGVLQIEPTEHVRVFDVVTSGLSGRVVADLCVVMEDEGEYYESSSLWPE